MHPGFAPLPCPAEPPPGIYQSRFLAFSLTTDAGVMLLLCPGDGLPHGFLAGGLPAPLVAARGLSLHKCVFFMMPLGLRKRGTCFTQSGAGSHIQKLEIKTPRCLSFRLCPLLNLETLRQAFRGCHVAFGPLGRSCVGSERVPPHSAGCTG